MMCENVTTAHSSLAKSNFTLIHNEIIDHLTLTPLAKFLLIYLVRQSKDWVFHDSVMMKHLQCKGTKLKELFSELRVAGYVKTVAIRGGVNGAFTGSKRVFADRPVFLLENQNPCKNDVFTESRVGRQSVNTESRLGVSHITNTNSVTNTNRDLTYTNNNKNMVVVDFGLEERLGKHGVNKPTSTHWQKLYGVEYVESKLKMLQDEIKRGTPIQSYPRWLNAALRSDFQPSIESKQQSSPASHEYAERVLNEVAEREKMAASPTNRKLGRQALDSLRGIGVNG